MEPIFKVNDQVVVRDNLIPTHWLQITMQMRWNIGKIKLIEEVLFHRGEYIYRINEYWYRAEMLEPFNSEPDNTEKWFAELIGFKG